MQCIVGCQIPSIVLIFRSVLFLRNVSRAPTRPAFQLTLAVVPLEKVQSAHVFVSASTSRPAACRVLPLPSQLFPPAFVRQPCFAHASACEGRLTERCCCRWDILCGDSVGSSRPSLQIRLSLQGTSALTAAPLPSASDMLGA